jgi:hypothetical protein
MAAARQEGRNAARADAVAICALCTDAGRPDLIAQLAGGSIANARRVLGESVWLRALTAARKRG